MYVNAAQVFSREGGVGRVDGFIVISRKIEGDDENEFYNYDSPKKKKKKNLLCFFFHLFRVMFQPAVTV